GGCLLLRLPRLGGRLVPGRPNPPPERRDGRQRLRVGRQAADGKRRITRPPPPLALRGRGGAWNDPGRSRPSSTRSTSRRLRTATATVWAIFGGWWVDSTPSAICEWQHLADALLRDAESGQRLRHRRPLRGRPAVGDAGGLRGFLPRGPRARFP